MKKAAIASTTILLLGFQPAAFADPIPVRVCGSVVTGKAELVANLDCSSYPGSVVVILGRGSLRLNGFTIAANTAVLPTDVAGVACRPSVPGKTERCKVIGPGTITGGSIGIDGGFAPRVSNVTITDAGTAGIIGGNVVVRGSVIQDNGWRAVHYSGRGIYAASVLLTSSDVSNNAEQGIWSNGGRVRIRRSTLVGNGMSPNCAVAPNQCADLVSSELPRLRDSTCGTSKHPDQTTLGVCADD